MIKNFILAFRTISNYRLYSVVNIIGLALSLACTIILARYIYRETTVEGYNTNLDRIYAITSDDYGYVKSPQLNFPWNPNNDPGFIDPLTDPAILKATEYMQFDNDNITIGDRTINADVMATDSNFLEVIELQLQLGDRRHVLRNPNGALISREFADIYFPDTDPMGQHLRHSSGREVTIEGVVDKPDTKSIFRFDVIVSKQLSQHWSRMPNGLVLVAPNNPVDSLNARHDVYMEMKSWDKSMRYQFVPLHDLYFSNLMQPYQTMYNKGDRQSIRVLMVVAALVLLVGVFNFVNIYTVLMLRRSRELGVKKVFGASTASIVRTLYVENLVMISLAVLLGWVLATSLREVILSAVGIPYRGSLLFDIGLTLFIVVVMPLLTTIYPTLKCRYSRPITSIRSVGGGHGSILSRAIFMVAQYVITIVMIVVSLYFVRQLNFMLNTDLGFDTRGIVQSQFIKWNTSYDRTDEQREAKDKKRESDNQLICTELDASPLVEQWCFGEVPLRFGDDYTTFKTEAGESRGLVYVSASVQWMDMFGIRMVEGDLFDDSVSRWSDYKLIATQEALRTMGVKDYKTEKMQPAARLWSGTETPRGINPPYEIIGVAHDFRTEHLSRGPLPLFMVYDDGARTLWSEPLLVRFTPGREQEGIEMLRTLHARTVGGEFEYKFVEEMIRDMYTEDRRVSTIYAIFAAIAILISSLGLFSLSLYDVQQRYREIALRRVNGASVSEIVGMLLRKYYILLSIAFIIAAPAGWLIIDWYMRDFAVRAPFGWDLLLMAGVVTAAVSLLTLLWQTLRAARTNPAVAMKVE